MQSYFPLALSPRGEEADPRHPYHPGPLPPPGSRFTVRRAADGATVVRHPAGNRGGMVAAWVVWTGIALVPTVAVQDGPTPLPAVVFFWGVDVMWLLFAVHTLLASTDLRLEPEGVLIRTRVLGVRRGRWVGRADVRAVRERDDTDEDGVVTGSRSIELRAGETIGLVGGASSRDALWFGTLLARWAGVPFERVPDRWG